MAVYAIWNNKGGVGKSYLTFQISCEYAATHPNENVLVVDLCPQANASGMILGGLENGDKAIEQLTGRNPSRSISGYINDRIISPYINPFSGSNYLTQPSAHNTYIPENLYLVCGDEELEIQSSQVQLACSAGPSDAWRIVHTWVRDLTSDVQKSWDQKKLTVFIDCNPSFTVYTELAISAADRLIVPFTADGSSKRAVKSVLSLVYGILRKPGQRQSQFFLNTQQYRMARPQIYSYVGNRLTQMNQKSAGAFKSVVNEIFNEVYEAWQKDHALFCAHPTGAPAPTNKKSFRDMFEEEINDANTVSVVSGSLGIPIGKLTDGFETFLGKRVKINQSQLDKQYPNIRDFVAKIE